VGDTAMRYELKIERRHGLDTFIVYVNGTQWRAFLSIELALTAVAQLRQGTAKVA